MKYYEESRAMSDDEDNVDLDSDDGDDVSADGNGGLGKRQSNNQYYSQAEKRAHHNALERKRRDHIKDSFTSLRDSVPSLQGEKQASRAQILKKAAEYIQFMRRKNNSHQQDIDDLKKQNNALESQIRALDRAKASGNLIDNADAQDNELSGSSTDENEVVEQNFRNKKMKTGSF